MCEGVHVRRRGLRPLRCHTFAGREGIRIPFFPVGCFRHVAGGYRGVPIRLMPVVFLFPVTLPERMFVSGPGRIFRPECGMKRQVAAIPFRRMSPVFVVFRETGPQGSRIFSPVFHGWVLSVSGRAICKRPVDGREWGFCGRVLSCRPVFHGGFPATGRAVLLNRSFVCLFPDIFRFLRGDFICMVLVRFSGKGSRPDGRR